MASVKDFVYPEPNDDDDDDVVWALQAGVAEWQRGGNVDAVVWLRRAIEAANAAGNAFRAGEIQAAVDELMEVIWAGSEPPQADVGDRLSAPLLEMSELAAGEAAEVMVELDPEELNDDDLVVAEESWQEEDTGEIFEVPALGSAAEGILAGLELGGHQDTVNEDAASHDDDLESAEEEEEAQELDDDSQAVREVQIAAVPEPSGDPLEEPDTDIMRLVTSVRSPSIDRGSEPVDEVIASGLELERRRSLLPAAGARADQLPPLGSERVDLAIGSFSQQTASSRPPSPVTPPPSASPSDYPTAPGAAPDAALLAGGSLAPVVDGVPLSECAGFEDLPEEAQRVLAEKARLERLSIDEEVSGFGAALVTHGAVAIVTTVSEEPALIATKGDVVFTEGSLSEGTQLRVVSTSDNTVVAVWTPADLERALSDRPWVGDELRRIADRFQALAGVTLGVLGERLDASLRRKVTDRMEVQAYAPSEVVIHKGVAIPGLSIVGAGRVEIISDDEQVSAACLPGDFIFPEGVLASAPAQSSVRAGPKGALLLFAPRPVAHELITSVPPLLEALVS